MANEQAKIPEQHATKWLQFNLKVDLSTLLLAGIAIYFMFNAHAKNMENITKVEVVITKYEAQIDKMITEDKKSLQHYKRNLKDAMSSLSKDERKLLEHVFTLSEKKTQS
ncbi:hypothetical protein ACWXWU_00550 [Shewanella sp. A14]